MVAPKSHLRAIKRWIVEDGGSEQLARMLPCMAQKQLTNLTVKIIYEEIDIGSMLMIL